MATKKTNTEETANQIAAEQVAALDRLTRAVATASRELVVVEVQNDVCRAMDGIAHAINRLAAAVENMKGDK